MEATFIYFSELNTLSIQNKFILSIFSLFEALDLLVYIFKAPNKINFFVTHNSKIITAMEYFSFYHHFLQLTNCTPILLTKCQYPYYLFLIIVLFPFLLLLFSKLRPDPKMLKSKTKCFLIKAVIINLYDHFIFRLFSIEFYDTIISFVLQNNSSYCLEAVGLICFFICLGISFKYLNTFRLCVGFDKDTRYPFDEGFSMKVDMGAFLIKIFICFDTWYENQGSDLRYIFLVMNVLLMLIINVYTLFSFDCINAYNCLKGMFFLNSSFAFFFHLLLCYSGNTPLMIALLFVIIVFLPFVIIIFLRDYRLDQIIQGDDLAKKFSLLFYYYPSKKYSEILTRICFNERIQPVSSETQGLTSSTSRSEGEKAKPNVDNLLLYLNHVTKTLQKRSKPISHKEEFILHLIVIYKKILKKESIDFPVFNQIRLYLKKASTENVTFYFNIKFFYHKLCEIDLCINKDRHNLLNCYAELFGSINKFIKEVNQFIDNVHFVGVKEYFDFADHLNVFFNEAKVNYNILALDNKEEYQRTIMRILLENILNRPISQSHLELFAMEDLMTFEDLLEKQYKMDNYLKIKIMLHTSKIKVIKVSKELNALYDKGLEGLFPVGFSQLAKKLFYKEKDQEAINIGEPVDDYELYQFIIIDSNENIRTFSYSYKLYHNLEKDILFLDGFYRLGSEVLAITEENAQEEYITLISKKLENVALIDQKLIVFLRKYDIRLSLKAFSENKVFYIKNYYDYLHKIFTELSEVCSCDEIPYMQKVIDKINKTEASYTEFWFNTVAKIYDNSRNVTLHLCKFEQFSCDIRKQNRQRHYDEESKRESVSKNNNNPLGHSITRRVNQFGTNFDTNSISSVSTSILASSSGPTSIKIRKKKEKKLYKANSYLIIILNIVVIAIALFCLLYENSLNISLLNLLDLYHTVYVLNRTILHTIISFLSLLCFSPSPKQKCEKRLLSYLNGFKDYSSLYDFTFIELQAKINFIGLTIHDLRLLLTGMGNPQLNSIFTKEAEICHLKFENGQFLDEDVASDLNSVLIQNVNKLAVLIEDKKMLYVDIYPIELSENFKVISGLPGISALSQDQLYIYEVLTKYLTHINLFLLYQKTLEDLITNTKSSNMMSLAIFIVVLVLFNLFILYLCWLFLKKFNKLIKEKLEKIQSILAVEANVSLLKAKFAYLSELKKLYAKNPTKIITQLIETTRKNKHLKTNQTEKSPMSRKDKQAKDKQSKSKNGAHEPDLSFITSHFISILSISGIVYVIYCGVFFILFNDSFTKIESIVEVLKTSARMEEETYLSLCLIHLLQFTRIKGDTLMKLFYTHFALSNDLKYSSQLYESNDFFHILINSVQISFQKEVIIYSNSSFFQPHNSVLDFNCETMYSAFSDVLYVTIFPFHDKDYERALISFCSSNKVMESNNERIFLNELHYKNMKLLSVYSFEDSDLGQYDFSLNELFLLTSQLLFIFRPLRTFIGYFYFKVVLKSVLDYHFANLLTFLIVNIVLQILNFILIKVKILNNMEKCNKNIEGLLKALKPN